MSEKQSVYNGKIALLQTMVEPGDDAATIFEQLMKLELGGAIEDRYVEAMMLERGLSYDLLLNEEHMEVMRRMFMVRLTPAEAKKLAAKKKEIAQRQQEKAEAPKIVESHHRYIEWLAMKDLAQVAVVAGKRDDSVATLKGYRVREVMWFEPEGALGVDFESMGDRDRYVANRQDMVIVIDRYAVQEVQEARSVIIDDWDQVCSVDCEMVGSKEYSRLSAVVAVDKDGAELYRAVVKPRDEVTSFREQWSTITKAQVLAGRDEVEVVSEVRALLKGKVVVMHDCREDLKVLPGLELRGVVDTYVLTGLSLKNAYRSVTGKEMIIAHDPGEDARAAMIIARAKATMYDPERWLQFNDSSFAGRQERERVERAKRARKREQRVKAKAQTTVRPIRKKSRYRLEVYYAKKKRNATREIIDALAKRQQYMYDARVDEQQRSILTVATRGQVSAWQSALAQCGKCVVTTLKS